MAVTKQSVRPENGTDGTATLWSATVDALAAGTSVAVRDDRTEAGDRTRTTVPVASNRLT